MKIEDLMTKFKGKGLDLKKGWMFYCSYLSFLVAVIGCFLAYYFTKDINMALLVASSFMFIGCAIYHFAKEADDKKNDDPEMLEKKRFIEILSERLLTDDNYFGCFQKSVEELAPGHLKDALSLMFTQDGEIYSKSLVSCYVDSDKDNVISQSFTDLMNIPLGLTSLEAKKAFLEKKDEVLSLFKTDVKKKETALENATFIVFAAFIVYFVYKIIWK